jgi:hypothetical protein
MQIPSMVSIIRGSIDRTTTLDEACTALESNPQNPVSWLGFIESLLACGRTEQAVAALALGGRHGLAGPTVEGFRERPATAAERDLQAEREAGDECTARGPFAGPTPAGQYGAAILGAVGLHAL